MAEWFPLALLAGVIWAAADLIDKYIIEHELRDPIFVSIFNGIGAFFLFTLASLLFGNIWIPIEVVVLAIITGAVYASAVMLYFEAMKKEDISLAAPMLATAPLFVLLFAFFLLDERLTPIKYAGIFLIVGGAMLVSFRNAGRRIKWDNVAFLVLGAAALVGLRNTLMKYITLEISVWSVLFWVGVGGLLMTLVIFAMHHPHVARRWKMGVRHSVVLGGFSALAFFFLTHALAVGPVSLVSAIVAVKPLVVFLAATAISMFSPGFLREHVTPAILLRKSIATILIVIGAALVVV